jgi:hypothetical protein
MQFLKTKVDLFADFSQKLIGTYNFIEFIPNFTNALYDDLQLKMYQFLY